MNAEKCALRQRLRERRRALPCAVVEAAGAAVCAQLRTFAPYRSARTVVAYIAHENEIPITALLEEIAQSEVELCLPRVAQGEALVPWRPGEPLRVGPGGVLEPAGRLVGIEGPAVVLVPVVGWDGMGGRLGRGGGFYDRVFAHLPQSIMRVGLAYEFQEVPQIPCDPWDIRLHYVITERRIMDCVRGGEMPSTSLQKGGLQLS